MDTPPLIAITIRQPMAWAVIFADPVKDVENRSTPGVFRRHRGVLAIHSSANTPAVDWDDYEYFIARVTGAASCPPREELAFGSIIGLVELLDVVSESDSPWFVGPYGLVLANPRPLTPVACRGQLGLWPVPPAVRAQIAAQGVTW
jgi:hypothetical protein